ncbi:hypothetical protein C2G38_2146894 [Gigaspora rosea]|uniref:B30.2/SPRY domain-containing protein n=1 Tax=Gigaspora rosea TaxID=44941 RepID=A0A397UF24_9GLOM|nr:hypothetical protein C2G38_2146894 [Gigaspora rosea]
MEDKENKENKSWGCAYHGDDGDFFCSGSGKPYGPTYTVGDTIGCYLNFRNDDKMIFYTKNGINLGIVCYLPNNLDDLKNNLYPCIGLRSQDALATQICLGHRPEIRCEVPQLLLDLMNKCLDAEPQNRPTAKALEDILRQFTFDKTTELYKQIEEIKNLDKNFSIYNQANLTKSTRFNYQTHKQAIYTSRFLNFQKLPKPVNSAISHSIELNEVPDI